jgi:hypothetical protein
LWFQNLFPQVENSHSNWQSLVIDWILPLFLLTSLLVPFVGTHKSSMLLLLFVVLNKQGPVQGKAKPKPPLHAGLIPVKTCSTFILCFFSP